MNDAPLIPPPPAPNPADRHSLWGIHALWEQLLPMLPELSIEVVDHIESTNQALMDRLRHAALKAQGRELRADDLAPSLLVAVQQTQGKGRLGRSWESAPGSSLTFSLSLPIHRADWSGLSLAVGVAAAEALDPNGHEIGLKWPNDLWRVDGPGRGRKLGGVLIEALQVGEQRFAVIGIGINLRPLHLPQNVQEAIASVSEFEPDLSAPQALARICPRLAQRLQDFERGGFAGIAAAYAQRDLLRGHAVTTTDAACPEGESLGVAEDGALLVRCNGEVQRIVSGEVSVRPLAAAPR
ncbi:biotin--[acetyl-CoA-carboxylase] ligase [Ideonella azotifigens]|uniref:biotin--[biotin carboxyl-carrier protein] ligase n=2 Tax=Ideonella azotifigens TaxID=513160 RepID=A0ABN1JL78_9BURK|nr:biotin--[acetyl-CoA-carboxylase] ligase [Ideonella azotifigens]MCD2339698.1 biotin--[acetyl-CoA-carboxylase] ligase [Ideonella azotifigens]